MTHGPSSDRFLQIGEAAEQAGITQRTLRYYEEKGLLDPPSRMEGGFRLYTPEDIERVGRIRQLKELLGFSLAEIKEMLEADDLRHQVKAEWRHEADAAEKAERIRHARDITVQQLQLIDLKMGRMAELRDQLAAKVKRYDEALHRWDNEAVPAR